MPASKNYQDKYGPMLYLLNTVERNVDYLASKPGYREELAQNYRDDQRKTLRGYMLELETDCHELFDAAAAVAVHDAELARALSDCRRAFAKTMRYIRLRLALDPLIPVPNSKRSATALVLNTLRTLMLKLVPRATIPRGLLVAMNGVRNLLNPNT